MTDDPQAVWRSVYFELKQAASDGQWRSFDPQTVIAIANAFRGWAESGNAHHVDLAMELILASDAPQSPSIRKHLTEAIQRRRAGEVSGTWKQVQRQHWQHLAFTVVCILRYHGLTIDRASRLASVWLRHHSQGEFDMTDASMERKYQDQFVKSGQQDQLHTAWDGEIERQCPKRIEDIASLQSFLDQVGFRQGARR